MRGGSIASRAWHWAAGNPVPFPLDAGHAWHNHWCITAAGSLVHALGILPLYRWRSGIHRGRRCSRRTPPALSKSIVLRSVDESASPLPQSFLQARGSYHEMRQGFRGWLYPCQLTINWGMRTCMPTTSHMRCCAALSVMSSAGVIPCSLSPSLA